jgi:PAS domain S-box-containing protein
MGAHKPVNVLLVDDQPAKLLSYEVILGELGENLIKASSAREALEQLLKNDVAVILTDVCMPELDGFQLAAMLREHPRFEKTAIIFVSAVHMSDLDHLRGYQSGAVDYITVPVVPELLRAKVKVFVELYRKTRELEELNDELEARVEERTAELQASTSRLRASEERLRLASEAAEFGTYDLDLAHDRIHCSLHLKTLLGTDVGGDLSLDAFLALIHPADREVVRACLIGECSGSDRHEVEFRVLEESGAVRWLLDRGSIVRGNGEGPTSTRATGTILDITERKRVEERQRLLMAELDHRVKNILANLSAVARLSSVRAASVKGFVEALDGRIQAMSRAHALLRQGNWNGADLADLAYDLLTPFRSGTEHNIRIAGPRLTLSPKNAQAFALLLHELATNAVKHGALSRPGGAVEVSWTRRCQAEGEGFRFVWREVGGPPACRPQEPGFGLTVLRAAASEFGGSIDCQFRDEGIECVLDGCLEGEGKREADLSLPSGSFEAARVGQAATGATCIGHAAARGRILVVEDEPFVALQLQSDLESDGYEVIGPAANVAQGERLAQCEALDAALVDVSLGPATSASIAEYLLERRIPFAFATGYADGSILPEHLRTVPRLAKPYGLDDVRKVLNMLLGTAV